MFTGIVQGTARVSSIRAEQGILRIQLALVNATDGLVVGASVAIAGTCLTAVAVEGELVSFDCIAETVARTTLGGLSAGDRVNYERAARIGDEIGGHLLSGHIVGTALVVARDAVEGNLVLTLEPPPEAVPYVFPKGFVALDGVSLTVGNGSEGRFQVHLIPETRRVTTLDALTVGDRVNLELDAMTQAVVDTVSRVLADQRLRSV